MRFGRPTLQRGGSRSCFRRQRRTGGDPALGVSGWLPPSRARLLSGSAVLFATSPSNRPRARLGLTDAAAGLAPKPPAGWFGSSSYLVAAEKPAFTSFARWEGPAGPPSSGSCCGPSSPKRSSDPPKIQGGRRESRTPTPFSPCLPSPPPPRCSSPDSHVSRPVSSQVELGFGKKGAEALACFPPELPPLLPGAFRTLALLRGVPGNSSALARGGWQQEDPSLGLSAGE